MAVRHISAAQGVSLSEADLRAALEFVHRISSAPDPDEFAATATQGLYELIRCDIATYSEINPAKGRAVPMSLPVGVQRPDADEAFSRNIHEHPLVAYYAAGNTRAATMSEFLSSRQFHRTHLYDELFRPVSGEYLLAATLPLPPPIVAGWGLLRSSRDFSARDRMLLDLLQPHLASAYERSLMRAALGALDEAAAAGNLRLVVLGMDGGVLYMTPPALAALRRYFGVAVREDTLPGPISEWLGDGRDRPLSFVHDGQNLRIDSLGGRPAALLLTERTVKPSLESLRRLGLSKREADVLALVADGRSNAEIARLLSVSAGTVKRHLERVYAKLDVHTRTAAAAAAWAESDPAPREFADSSRVG